MREARAMQEQFRSAKGPRGSKAPSARVNRFEEPPRRGTHRADIEARAPSFHGKKPQQIAHFLYALSTMLLFRKP
jgi:hypothetical protein